MAKRMQEQTEEDRIVAKSKPTAMNLTSTVKRSSSSLNHPIASKSPEILQSIYRKPHARARINSKPDAASSSQGRLRDAYLGGWMVEVAVKPAATDKSQESWEFSESESWSNHEKKVTGKPVHPEIQKIQGIDYENSPPGGRRLYYVAKLLITNAKTYVFSESVLCLGGISDQPIEPRKNKIKCFFGNSPSPRFESNRWRADGVRVETFPRIHFIGNSRGDSKDAD